MNIKIVKLSPNAIIPKPATGGSAGCDLHACIQDAVEILPNQTVKIQTGISIELPTNQLVGMVYARSGLGINHNITPANCVGVIDSDYRGEIIVGLKNSSDKSFVINPGDRIAQLLIMPIVKYEFIESDRLSSTERSDGGFGSTGS